MDSSQLGSGYHCIVRGPGLSMLLCDALNGQVLSTFNYYKGTSQLYEVEYDRWATKAILICKLGSVGFGREQKQINGFLGWDIRTDSQLFSVRLEDTELSVHDSYSRQQQQGRTTISINQAGNKFVSTTPKRSICLWDAIAGTKLGEIGVTDVVRAWLSFDDVFVVADSRSELRVWDSATGTLVSSLNLGDSLSGSSPSSQKSAVVGLGNASYSAAIIVSNRLCIFDYQSGLRINDLLTLCAATNNVDTVVFSQNDELVATTPVSRGAGMNKVRVWNTQGGEIVHAIARPKPGTRLEFNSNDNTVLFDSGNAITQACLLSGKMMLEQTTFTDVITHMFSRPAGVILL
jgi:WD40 repeat protein